MALGTDTLMSFTVYLPSEVGAEIKRASLKAKTSSSRLLESFISNRFKDPQEVELAVEEVKTSAAGK